MKKYSEYIVDDKELNSGSGSSVYFVPYKGGNGPVICLKDMSPEKQREMLELYSEPGYSNNLNNKANNGNN